MIEEDTVRTINIIVLSKPFRAFKRRVKVNDRKFSANVASWTFYIPDLQIKHLHSFQRLCHCLHKTAIPREISIEEQNLYSNPEYTIADWQQVYKKSVARRAAENYVCAKRLYEAGLGSEVGKPVFVRQFFSRYGQLGWTCGYEIDNHYHHVEKCPASREDCFSAGVIPERIESCIRQQINGYVSDLNLVIGVLPVGGELAVERIQNLYDQAILEAGYLPTHVKCSGPQG